MRWQFIFFFIVFFSIYFGANYYIFQRGLQALELFPRLRPGYIFVFWILAFFYFISRWIENYFSDGINYALIWSGSFWLGMITYLFLLIILVDLARSLLTISGHAPQLWLDSYALLKFLTGIGVFGISVLVLLFGWWNALTPKIKPLEIEISKNGGSKQEWRVAVVSDIHAGTIINRTRFAKLVSYINGLNPDLVILVGDTVDEDIKPVIREDIGDSLKNIRSEYGIYAVTGNHEYIGGVDEATAYLSQHGVILLRDESVLIGDSFYLVGREDRSAERFYAGKARKSVDELLNGLDLERPIVMLDHQPADLKGLAANRKVDFQLSGHTHHGQLWPFNFITGLIFDISYGYGKFENTQFYVSSGWGTWGPPSRTSSSPEIVDLRLKFR